MIRKRKIDIEAIIRILRKETRDFGLPSVSRIAEEFSGKHKGLPVSGRRPFLVLISCILSLRTQDKTTIRASRRLFGLARTPLEMLKLRVDVIEKAIYPVGFYHTKARRIKEISKKLVERFNSQVPDTLEDLLEFKGVGRKTANLVLTEGFGKLGICVDTHVHRITNRLGFCATNSPEDTEECLRDKLPQKHWIEYNTLLVSWGQNVCRPVSPLCGLCAIEKYCLKIKVGKHK